MRTYSATEEVDAVVVGTALIDVMAKTLVNGQATETTLESVSRFVQQLASGVRSVTKAPASFEDFRS